MGYARRHWRTHLDTPPTETSAIISNVQRAREEMSPGASDNCRPPCQKLTPLQPTKGNIAQPISLTTCKLTPAPSARVDVIFCRLPPSENLPAVIASPAPYGLGAGSMSLSHAVSHESAYTHSRLSNAPNPPGCVRNKQRAIHPRGGKSTTSPPP